MKKAADIHELGKKTVARRGDHDFPATGLSGIKYATALVHRRQQTWSEVQMKRCRDMGTALYRHHQKTGNYPTHLHDLVAAGLLTENRYRELMFQQSPGSEPLKWKYSDPGLSHGRLLFSGKPVVIWNHPVTTYILGGADGSVQAFGEEKLPMYQRDPVHLVE